jgi:hypothetical protein
MIAGLTNGSHHVIGRLTTETEMIDDMIKGIKEDQRKIVNEKPLSTLD